MPIPSSVCVSVMSLLSWVGLSVKGGGWMGARGGRPRTPTGQDSKADLMYVSTLSLVTTGAASLI